MSPTHHKSAHEFASNNGIGVLITMIMEAHQDEVIFVNGHERQPSDNESTASSQNDIKHGPRGLALPVYILQKIPI